MRPQVTLLREADRVTVHLEGLVRPYERRIRRWRHALEALVVAGAFAAAGIALVAFLRADAALTPELTRLRVEVRCWRARALAIHPLPAGQTERWVQRCLEAER